MPERTPGETMRQLASVVDEIEAAGHDVHDAGVVDDDEDSPPVAELTVTLDPTAGPQPDAPGIQAPPKTSGQPVESAADESPDDDSPEPTTPTDGKVEPAPDSSAADSEPESDQDSDDGQEPTAPDDGVVSIEEIPGVSDKIASRLQDAGYKTAAAVRDADVSELSEIPYIGANRAAAVTEEVDNLDHTAEGGDGDPGLSLEEDDRDIEGLTLNELVPILERDITVDGDPIAQAIVREDDDRRYAPLPDVVNAVFSTAGSRTLTSAGAGWMLTPSPDHDGESVGRFHLADIVPEALLEEVDAETGDVLIFHDCGTETVAVHVVEVRVDPDAGPGIDHEELDELLDGSAPEPGADTAATSQDDPGQVGEPDEGAEGDSEEATTDGGQVTSDSPEVKASPGEKLGTVEVEKPYHRTRFPIPDRVLEHLGHPDTVSVVPEESDDKLALAAGTGWDDVHITYDVDDDPATVGIVAADGIGVTEGGTVTFRVSKEVDGAVSMRRASAGQPTTPKGGERR